MPLNYTAGNACMCIIIIIVRVLSVYNYCTYMLNSLFNYRRLLNEVVRLKVHSEETFSRLNKEKGDDVINVRLACSIL